MGGPGAATLLNRVGKKDVKGRKSDQCNGPGVFKE